MLDVFWFVWLAVLRFVDVCRCYDTEFFFGNKYMRKGKEIVVVVIFVDFF